MSIPSLNNNSYPQEVKKTSHKSKNADFNKTLRTSFKCPIGYEFMKDPLTTKCGHIFENAQITNHLQKDKTCPTCRAYCVQEMLTPAREFKNLIDAWKKAGHGEDTTVESDSESDIIEIILPSKNEQKVIEIFSKWSESNRDKEIVLNPLIELSKQFPNDAYIQEVLNDVLSGTLKISYNQLTTSTGKKIPWKPSSSKAMHNQQQRLPMGNSISWNQPAYSQSFSNNNNNQYILPQQQQQFQPMYNQNYSYNNINNNQYLLPPQQQHFQPAFNQHNIVENFKRKTDRVSDVPTPSTKKRRLDLDQLDLYPPNKDQVLNHLAQLDMVNDLEVALIRRPEIIHWLDKDGNSLLHLVAKMKQNHKFIEVVINQGGVINQKNIDGNTPLHLAIENHHLKNSKALLNAGANKNIENNEKLTQESMMLKLSDAAYKFLISKKRQVSRSVKKYQL